MNTLICYFVAAVTSLASMNGVDEKKLTYGIRQITEDMIQEKYQLCPDGKPVEVVILSIEAPTQGLRIGPFEFKSKKTIVKSKVIIDGKEYFGTGIAKTNVAATLLQLQDDNLPFERTEFSIAVKKSLEDALD